MIWEVYGKTIITPYNVSMTTWYGVTSRIHCWRDIDAGYIAK